MFLLRLISGQTHSRPLDTSSSRIQWSCRAGACKGGGKRAGKLALGRARHVCACSHLCLPQQGRTQWSSGQCGPSSCHSSRRIIQPRPEEADVRQRGGSSCGMGTLSSAMLQTSVRACVHSPATQLASALHARPIPATEQGGHSPPAHVPHLGSRTCGTGGAHPTRAPSQSRCRSMMTHTCPWAASDREPGAGR